MPVVPRRLLSRGLVLAAIGLAALAPAGCKSREDRFADRVARAEELAEEGHTREAILEYSSALKLLPGNADVNERIAALLAVQGEFDRAAAYYREAYRLDPGRIEAAMNEARLLLGSDRARAEQLVARGLAEAPENSAVHRVRSELLLVKGDTMDALGSAVAAAKVDPNVPENWLQIARCHRARIRVAARAGRPDDDAMFESALGALRRAESVGGTSLAIQLERAELLAAWSGHGDQAEEAYRAAVAAASEAHPSERQAVAAAAAGFAERTQRRTLRSWALRQVVDANPGSLAGWRELAELAEADGGSADGVFAELLEKRSDDPAAHELYVAFLVSKGRQKAAIDHLERTVEGGIDSALLGEELVRMQIGRGRLPSARAALTRLQDRFPDDRATGRAQARVALAEGRPAKAARLLRPLAQEELDFETERLLALAEYRSGQFDAALAAVDRAIALSPDSASAIRLKARIHHDTRDWPRTLRAYNRLRKDGKHLSPDEQLRLARALYEVGQTEAGRDALQKLLSTPKPPPAAAVEFARREGAGDPEAALAHLRGAHERAPADFDVLKALVDQEIAAGRVQDALVLLNNVIGSHLAGPRILLLRARLLAEHNALDRAEADALRAFEASPALDGAIDLLVLIYSAQGKTEEALRSFEEAEEAGVLHWGARMLLARLYLVRGETAKAQVMLEKVIEQQPSATTAKRDLALALAERGTDMERALELAKAARSEKPTDPTIVHTFGYIHFKEGRYEAALKAYEEAVVLAAGARPDLLPSFHYHVGLAQRALGRERRAAESFETALGLDANFPGAADARRQLDATRPGNAS